MATVTAKADKTRMDPELGLVRRCARCKEWWPADGEFYRPRHLTCTACVRDRENKRPIVTRPTTHGNSLDMETKRRKDRERKAALRLDPILGDKLRARQRQAQQRFYERNRLTILERHRESYAKRVGRPIREGFGRPRIAA